MVAVKEAMNEVEKTNNEFFRHRMLSVSTYSAIFYFGWRAKRVLKKSKRRALVNMNATKQNGIGRIPKIIRKEGRKDGYFV